MDTNNSVKTENSTITIKVNPALKRILKRTVISILIVAVIGGLGCAAVFGSAFHFARQNAIPKDEAINLAKAHLESNEIVTEVENLSLNDVEYDLEVELLDMKTSYLTYEIEFGTPDENRIFVDVNATSGVCAVKKISPPWWKAIIPN